MHCKVIRWKFRYERYRILLCLNELLNFCEEAIDLRYYGQNVNVQKQIRSVFHHHFQDLLNLLSWFEYIFDTFKTNFALVAVKQFRVTTK